MIHFARNDLRVAYLRKPIQVNQCVEIPADRQRELQRWLGYDSLVITMKVFPEGAFERQSYRH